MTISVPYDGVVSKLMYEVDDTAVKDKPLMIIDVDGEEGEGMVSGIIIALWWFYVIYVGTTKHNSFP